MNIEINPRYSHLKPFIKSIPEVFDHSGELVYDGRNKVKIFTEEGQKIVVKRFKTPLFFQRFDYTFLRPSKARRAYIFGLRLMDLHINTPEPIACIEVYANGLFHQGYFVSTFCGDPDLRILREEPDSHDDLMLTFVHFLIDMHEKGFIHGDTNLSNFLYHKDDSPYGYCITTIDINRSHFSPAPTRKACLKSLMRITHERHALHKIIKMYAQLRQWDEGEAINYVEDRLQAFEKRKSMKRKILK